MQVIFVYFKIWFINRNTYHWSVYTISGMVVEADGDISIHVGQINDLSSDVYLALPVDSLYTDYYAMTYVYTEDSVYPQVQYSSHLR